MAGISVGIAYTVLLGTDGSVWGWGSNQFGQLGRGTATSSGPAQVTGLTSATRVAAGFLSSYAVHTVPYLVGL